jgi:hypothetical protein
MTGNRAAGRADPVSAPGGPDLLGGPRVPPGGGATGRASGYRPIR